MSETPRILGGRYEVGELVGRGGMAEVHAGYDTRLGRRVAIKILRSDLARDHSFLQRFRREAKASAGLNHANIVAVYDSGEDSFTEAAGGTVEIPYIVMEYVDGQTLREVLNEEHKLPADEACRIMMGVLAALEYSHNRGIVHRDIKPGNVMVTRGGSVKVMDFGIARALADVGATMTSAQAVVGTARYLSPEQAQGQGVDTRSDLYSAGCVLFELLTGRAPFIGEPVSLVYQHIGEHPQPPSLYEQSVTPELDAVVLHSLEKDRDERYQDAAEFRQDVIAARSGHPVSAAAMASTYASADTTEVVSYPAAGESYDHTAEMDDRPQRRSHTAAWILAALLAIAGIFGIGYLFANEANKSSTVAVPNVVDMTYQQAEDALSPDFKVAKKTTASNKEEGRVLSESPGAGTQVKPGSTVTLTVSTGPNSIKIPDVTGDSQENAKRALQSAGVDPSRIRIAKEKRDDTGIEAGKIAATSPKQGESLGASDTITLYSASGKSTVPDVVGKDQQQATQALYAAHLSINVSTEQTEDPNMVGKVLSMEHKGEKMKDGTAIPVVIGTAAPATATVTRTPSSSETSKPSEPPSETSTQEPTATSTTSDVPSAPETTSTQPSEPSSSSSPDTNSTSPSSTSAPSSPNDPTSAEPTPSS